MRRYCTFPGCTKRSQHDDFCGDHHPDAPYKRPLPSEPLIALVEARGGFVGCADYSQKRERRAYMRAKKTGVITPAAADELSHALLGCHPCEVWPNQWFGPYGVSV